MSGASIGSRRALLSGVDGGEKKELTYGPHYNIFRNMEMINAEFAPASLEAEQKHAEAFKALSHRTRLAIFYHLVRQGEGGDTVGNLQEALGVPWATLSHHLDVLRRADLLASRREERFIYYRVRPERVSDLVRLLTACC